MHAISVNFAMVKIYLPIIVNKSFESYQRLYPLIVFSSLQPSCITCFLHYLLKPYMFQTSSPLIMIVTIDHVSFCLCQVSKILPSSPGDPCEPNPCLHGGQCLVVGQGPEGFKCNCPSGYSGRKCESKYILAIESSKMYLPFYSTLRS